MLFPLLARTATVHWSKPFNVSNGRWRTTSILVKVLLGILTLLWFVFLCRSAVQWGVCEGQHAEEDPCAEGRRLCSDRKVKQCIAFHYYICFMFSHQQMHSSLDLMRLAVFSSLDKRFLTTILLWLHSSWCVCTVADHFPWFSLLFLQRRHPQVHGAEAFVLHARSLVPCWPEAAGPGQWVYGLAAHKPPNARLQALPAQGRSRDTLLRPHAAGCASCHMTEKARVTWNDPNCRLLQHLLETAGLIFGVIAFYHLFSTLRAFFQQTFAETVKAEEHLKHYNPNTDHFSIS